MILLQQYQRPELVCPAGTPAALRTAVDAGADAVYCGLQNETNARNFPGLNFTVAEVEQSLGYAHARQARLLLAVNTFPPAGKFQMWKDAIDAAARLKVDAVIVADMGVADYAARTYPNLRLHLSVQAGASSPEAIRFYCESFGIEPGGQVALGILLVVYVGGRRADTIHVSGLADRVIAQIAASLRHHPDIAEDEGFDLAGDLPVQLGNLGDGQHTRQYHALDAEALAVEANSLGRGGTGLHRQMQAQIGISARGIIGDAHVGDDYGIDLELCCRIDRVLPHLEFASRREGVDREQEPRLSRMRVAER